MGPENLWVTGMLITMALSELLIQQAELEEKAIEQVVAKHVRYSDAGTIILLESFSKLPAKKQLATYLDAKAGWKYIPGKEALADGADNAELERMLRLPGGTIRPKTSELRSEGLIVTRDGKHFPTEQLVFALTADGEVPKA